MCDKDDGGRVDEAADAFDAREKGGTGDGPKGDNGDGFLLDPLPAPSPKDARVGKPLRMAVPGGWDVLAAKRGFRGVARTVGGDI